MYVQEKKGVGRLMVGVGGGNGWLVGLGWVGGNVEWAAGAWTEHLTHVAHTCITAGGRGLTFHLELSKSLWREVDFIMCVMLFTETSNESDIWGEMAKLQKQEIGWKTFLHAVRALLQRTWYLWKKQILTLHEMSLIDLSEMVFPYNTWSPDFPCAFYSYLSLTCIL